jgi:hypothetical protein
MSLGVKLTLCFIGFLLLVGIAMLVSFRERRIARGLSDGDVAAQQKSDARVLLVLFGSMLGGLAITLVVAWIIFL